MNTLGTEEHAIVIYLHDFPRWLQFYIPSSFFSRSLYTFFNSSVNFAFITLIKNRFLHSAGPTIFKPFNSPRTHF